MDDGNRDLTSSRDDLSTQTNSVIATDQSSRRNLDDPANTACTNEPLVTPPRVHPAEAAEPNANSSELVHSESAKNTSTPADEAPCSDGNTNTAKETAAAESLPCDAAPCDENAATSTAVLAHDQTSDDATSRTLNRDILLENNRADPANRMNSPAYSNCADFDRPNYSVEFAGDLSKLEKSNNLIASDLISSETMNDFFDEIYDMSYANPYKSRRVVESDTLSRSNYCADQIDGTSKDQDWSAPTPLSDFCSRPADQSTDSGNARSSLKRADETEPSTDYLPRKKAKKGITFDSVSVYYFPRTQGFTCIPSQGGSTLGMSWNHSHIRKFSLGEHAAEQRKAHRQLCSQQLDSTTNWNELSNISSEDSDSDEIVSDSEVDYENYNFLQPIPTRERRAMLRAAGIHKIDSREKDECRTIRLSREFCGCTCQIYCDPERCVCAQAGIKCQVDRMNFPCSCTRDGCANENGRIEFNPMRVRTHFIHTLMRLEMEKKKEEEEEHNHRLLFGDLDNMAQLAPYSTSALAPSSSSATSGANLLTTFSYHPDSLPYYAQPSSQQPSLYDVPSAPSSDSAQPPHPAFAYESHRYPMATATAPPDDSSYSQLTSVPSLTVLGETSSLASGYAMSGEQCLRLASAGYGETDALAQMRRHQQAGFHHGVEPFFAEDELAKEERGNVECHSECETLDTSAEVSEETEKEEESDVENFGDIIKKTMVESVIA